MALRSSGRRTAVIAFCILSTTTAAFAQNAGIGDPTDDDRSSGAFGRNCPEAGDSTIVVDPVATTVIRLPVTNAANADVSIYEYPLGGDFVQSGQSQLVFVFVPDSEFDGQATLRYRVTPKDDCDGPAQLGMVTLVGSRLTAPPVPSHLPNFHRACGIGGAHVLMLASAGAMLVFAVQRRRR